MRSGRDLEVKTIRQITAYHEAAHAVVAFMLGARVGGAHINEQDESAGKADICDRHLSREDRIAVAYAGFAAAYQEGVDPKCFIKDFERINTILEEECADDQERERVRKLGECCAKEIIAAQRVVIEAIVLTLVEKGTVSETELRDVLS
jgi:ATP-dependent Zn protease